MHKFNLLTQPSLQDTIPAAVPDTVRQDSVRVYSPDEAMQILLMAERRMQLIDSIQKAEITREVRITETPLPEKPQIDSSRYILFNTPVNPYDLPSILSGIERLAEEKLEMLADTHTYIRQAGKNDQTALLAEKPIAEQKKNGPAFDWIFLLLLVSFSLLAWLRLFYHRLFRPVLMSLINYQESYKLFRDKSLLFERFSFFLNFVYVLNGGLFIYLLLEYFKVKLPIDQDLVIWGFTSLSLVILYLVRWLTCRLLGFLSLQQELFAEYVHHIFLANKNAGLFLFPLIIGIPYLPEGFIPYLIYAGIFIFGTAYLMKLFRLVQIFVRKGVSIFYLFLYLCALEFLPISVAVKYIQDLS